MKCNFVAGQKVTPITVRSSQWWIVEIVPGTPQPPFPEPGKIYTISSIEPDGQIVYLSLKEMPAFAIYDYRGFRALRDRPAETNIGVFHPLLNTRELEDA